MMYPSRSPKRFFAAQVRAFRIADNKLTENADWDDRLLAQQLKDLSLLGSGHLPAPLTRVHHDAHIAHGGAVDDAPQCSPETRKRAQFKPPSCASVSVP
jgi:hypothetical protein